jgi:hypothetical protein
VVFIESRGFTKRLQELAGPDAEEVLSHIQGDLLANPERGSLLQGLGGLRKARSFNPWRSKGKRGGFRYFFLYLQYAQHIHLLLLLDKGEQEDLSTEERKELKRLVDAMKREGKRSHGKA